MKAVNMKSLVTLFQQVLTDCGDFCSANTSHDIKTVMTRFENEGFDFFTRTLPKLGSGLERALDLGYSTPDLYPSFKCRQNLPVLLGGFFELIFDRASGILLDEPSIESIRSIRQISLLMKKIELECGVQRTNAAFRQFVQSDIEVGEWEKNVDLELLMEFRRLALVIYSDVFSKVNARTRNFDLTPAHGPGKTAEKLNANAKYTFPMWTDRLETVAPYWRYADFYGYSTEKYSRIDFRSPEQELPVRVVDVPKTLEAPRIIAIEPVCMQYMQQAVFRAFRVELDQTYLVNFIGVESQEPNQLLALSGSLNGDVATLDLSEASDRVSNLLVTILFEDFPDLHDLVQASRSLRADVPSVGVVTLHRFASMGSALCFPVESMVFFTIVMMGIQKAQDIHFTKPHQVSEWLGQVRVYGDDICVPVDAVPYVVDMLEAFGLRVNNNKSFWTGKFRESCGKEYYSGEDVTLCRVRRPLPSSRKDVDEIISAVEFRNHAYKRGLWKTARWLDEFISNIIPFPAVAESSTLLGRYSFLGVDEDRMCPKLFRPKVKGAKVRYVYKEIPIVDEPALLKCLGFRQVVDRDIDYEPKFQNADHLIRAGRPDASYINIGSGYSA
jgi:hypothetical protein